MINIKSGVDFEISFVWKKADGTADTGLSPTVTMYKLSDSSAVFSAQAMTEVALGIYKYDIPTANLVSGETYTLQADGTASADDATLRYQYMAIAVDYQPTATAIADAVLDEALSGHTSAGTLGKAVADIETDATAILEDTGTTIPATLGTPVALDGGAATLGGMLTKMADDNGGADFDAETDSLNAIAADNPTVAEIADGVWDEVQSGHTTAGTFGLYLDQRVSRAGLGDGDLAVKINSELSGTSLQGVQVYLTSDAAGATRVTANQYSNSEGDTTWYLVDGNTYYVWQSKSGYTFNNPGTITPTS